MLKLQNIKGSSKEKYIEHPHPKTSYI